MVKNVVRTKLSDEDKILGKKIKPKTEKFIDYENPDLKYRITNLIVNNNPVIVDGSVIEGFIGGYNDKARTDLQKGAKSVTVYDKLSQKPIYRIETNFS